MTSGETSGEDGTLSNGKMNLEGLRGVWSSFGQGVDLHNGQRLQSVPRSVEDEDNAWPPG